MDREDQIDNPSSPLNSTGSDQENQGHPGGGGNRLPDVLVVEDNRLNSELVRIFLKDICQMDFARNGESAVEMARTKKYQTIIMDINLGPGMNGLEATEIIRTFEDYKTIPIIAVTGYAVESEKEQILKSGCSHFVSKPIEKNSFTSLIKSLTSKG